MAHKEGVLRLLKINAVKDEVKKGMGNLDKGFIKILYR